MSATEVPVTVLFNYDATDEDELTVKKDDVLLVLAMYDDGWWLIKRGNNTGLVPANYLELHEEPPKKSKTTDRAGRRNDKVQQQSGRSGNANSKEIVKNGSKRDSDLAELKNLREEAEEKINALSLAIEKNKIEEENAVAKRKSPKPTRNSGQSEGGEWKAPANSFPLVSQQQKQAPQKSNIQQVSLDPSSLKFISDIITERINYEFAVRDSRLMDRVKTMINSSTAPNSAIMIRDSEDRNGHNNNNSLVSNLNTPQRVRPSSTNAASASEPGSNFANGSVHLSLMKPGQHPSRIPMRVSLPKINSGTESNTEYGESLKPNAPKLIPRKPASTNDARLPHLANRSIVPSTQRHEEQREREREGYTAPSPYPSHVNSVIVESVPDGLQYPQCRSKVYGPSYAVEAPDPLPGAKLALHHVYGYDGDHNRHGSSNRGKNVLWADARRVAYPAAALVVVQEVSGDRRQGFFCGHSDDVTCLAVHPDRTVAASGQMGKDCCVLVWEIAKVKRGMSLNRNLVKLKAPAGMRGISAVDFSGDGRFLLAVGIDDTRLLMIFDWKEGTMVASAKFGHSEVNQVRFNPYEFTPLAKASAQQSPNSQKSEKTDAQCRSCYNLVSFGGKHIKFWTLKEFAAKEDTGLDSISTFKGRPLNRRKGEQSTNVKFVLEGNLGVMSKNAAVPEYTSMLIVNDNMDPKNDLSGGNIQTMPKSRVFFGSSTGSIYIWQQLDDDKLRSSLDKVNNGGMGMLAAPIFAWQPKGRLLSVVTELHDSPIIEMDYVRIRATDEDGEDRSDSSGYVERIISASSDGIVNVWLLNRHEANNALPLDHLGFLELHKEYARSVSWDPSGSSAILGTAENSVLLLSYEEEQVQGQGSRNASVEIVPKITIDTLTQSHNGKVRKLALHPIIPSIVASISSDKVVRLWDFRERALLTCFALTEVATAVTFSPNGAEIVLGNEKGEISVYACEALASLVSSYPCAFTANDFNNAEWSLSFKRSLAPKTDPGSSTPNKKKPPLKKIEIQEIKFSPLGDIVALGCKDNLVHLLSARTGFKHSGVCKGHGAPIRTIDFSSDGAVLQSSDATREVMHYEVATGKRLLSAAQFRDAVWSTFTSVYGWSVQGVFNNSEGVAAVDSDINCVDRSADAKWLVTGGSNTVHNAIKLFNYPCLGDAVPSLHGGHTSPVLDVKLLTGTDGTIEVASAGGNDSCMFQWRLLEYK